MENTLLRAAQGLGRVVNGASGPPNIPVPACGGLQQGVTSELGVGPGN